MDCAKTVKEYARNGKMSPSQKLRRLKETNDQHKRMLVLQNHIIKITPSYNML